MKQMGLLLEMAIYSEDDVFAMNPIAAVSTEIVSNLEGNELREYVWKQIKGMSIENPQNQIAESDIGILIRHHCGYRPRKKSALLALPHIINANYITHPWRRKVNKYGQILKGKDARQSGMISAPILIDGEKYLCNITQKIKVDGTIFPYALTLKDADGNIIEGEKMDCIFQVPDSNSEYPTFGDTHISKVTTSPDTNPSSDTNVQIKSNNVKKKGNNGSTPSSAPIQPALEESKQHRHMKKTITESQLRKIVTESVINVLKEGTYQDEWAKESAHIDEIKQIIKQLDTLYHKLMKEKESIPSACDYERDDAETEMNFIWDAREALNKYYKWHAVGFNRSVKDAVKWYGQKEPQGYPMRNLYAPDSYDGASKDGAPGWVDARTGRSWDR